MPAYVYLILGAVAFAGAVIQSTMGFGGAVLVINVMPLFFPVAKSVALIQGSVVVFNIVYFFIYRNKIRWDVLKPAIIPGTLIALIFSFVSVSIDMDAMNYALGALFIVLSFYYLFFVDRVHVAPSKRNGIFWGSFSGIANAFFSIAGPPAALYLAPSLDDKLEYFASSQAFFLFSNIACIIAKVSSGVYERADLPMMSFLMATYLLGSFFGIKILKKANGEKLKKYIYGFIGLNGVYIIVKQLLSK